MNNERKWYDEEFDRFLKQFNEGTDDIDIKFYKNMKESIFKLVKKFNEMGHSGSSQSFFAARIVNLVKNTLNGKALSPFLNEDDFKFQEINDLLFQSTVQSDIFKDEKGIFFTNAIVWVGEDGSFTGDRNGIRSSQYLKEYPFVPKTFYVDVKDLENGECEIVGKEELEKALNYFK